MDVKYLSIDKQIAIAGELDRLADREPLRNKIFFQYGTHISVLPMGMIFFLSWRAGFRGYGLFRYGKARLITIFPGIMFPLNGILAVDFFGVKRLTEPFRPENPWIHGFRYSFASQAGVFASIFGGLGLTFLFAKKSGVLPVPDGMHKKGIRGVTADIFLGRVRPYAKTIGISAAASTVLMFVVGACAYFQSRNLLAKMGRKTLARKEDP